MPVIITAPSLRSNPLYRDGNRTVVFIVEALLHWVTMGGGEGGKSTRVQEVFFVPPPPIGVQ